MTLESYSRGTGKNTHPTSNLQLKQQGQINLNLKIHTCPSATNVEYKNSSAAHHYKRDVFHPTKGKMSFSMYSQSQS